MKRNFVLIVKEEASNEILEAFDYYEEQQFGLGDYFLKLLRTRFDSLTQMPESNPIVYGNYRQAVVFKFPFVILYEIEENSIVVFSVFHTSRDPMKKPSAK